MSSRPIFSDATDTTVRDTGMPHTSGRFLVSRGRRQSPAERGMVLDTPEPLVVVRMIRGDLLELLDGERLLKLRLVRRADRAGLLHLEGQECVTQDGRPDMGRI